MASNEELFKKIISHAKEYGFVFQSSELYDGFSAEVTAAGVLADILRLVPPGARPSRRM